MILGSGGLCMMEKRRTDDPIVMCITKDKEKGAGRLLCFWFLFVPRSSLFAPTRPPVYIEKYGLLWCSEA